MNEAKARLLLGILRNGSGLEPAGRGCLISGAFEVSRGEELERDWVGKEGVVGGIGRLWEWEWEWEWRERGIQVHHKRSVVLELA